MSETSPGGPETCGRKVSTAVPARPRRCCRFPHIGAATGARGVLDPPSERDSTSLCHCTTPQRASGSQTA